MPAVSLTVSETLGGSAVSDSLSGGGVGVDLGSVLNGSYCPVTDKSSNTGAQNIYIRHNGVNAITSVRTFIETYTNTGFSYGGADTASNDFTTLKNQGNTSGDSKNNADGLSGGLWVDMNAFVSPTSQFDFVNNGYDSVGGTNGGNDTVRIYGDNLLDGIDLASSFMVLSEAMVYGPTETAASAPVDGQIGPAGNTVLGSSAHLKYRLYIRSDFVNNGLLQWALTVSYSFVS
jgi:hypothetical protein